MIGTSTLAAGGGPVAEPEPVASVRSIIVGTGPRFARDAFGPVLVFYVVWKVAGLVPGILAATVLALGAWWWERRCERPGLLARVTLVLVLLQAVIGLVGEGAPVYLGQPVPVSGLYGVAFVGSGPPRDRESTSV